MTVDGVAQRRPARARMRWALRTTGASTMPPPELVEWAQALSAALPESGTAGAREDALGVAHHGCVHHAAAKQEGAGRR
jgi:hypothetical protein